MAFPARTPPDTSRPVGVACPPPSPLTARLPRAALQVPAGGSELPGWHGGTGVSGVRGPGSPGRGDEGMRSLKGASTRPSQQPQEGSLAGNGGKGKCGVRRASPSKRHVSLLTCEGNRDHHRSHGDPEGGGPERSGLEPRRPLGRRGQPLLASGTVLCRDAHGSRCQPCAPVTCARQALGWGGLSTPRCPVPAAAVSFGSRLRCLKTPE